MADDKKTDPIEELVRRVVQSVQPLKIILFGSTARGDAGPASDVDLLVVMPEGTHRRHTAQDLYQQMSGISVSVDIVVATPTDLEKYKDTIGLIYRNALREGRELYAA